jgi:hypothetical protein
LRCITYNKGPNATYHPDYKDVHIIEIKGWENGVLMTEPVKVKEKYVPLISAIHAKEYGLLDTPG